MSVAFIQVLIYGPGHKRTVSPRSRKANFFPFPHPIYVSTRIQPINAIHPAELVHFTFPPSTTHPPTIDRVTMFFFNIVIGAVLAMLQICDAGAIPMKSSKNAPSLEGPLAGYGIQDITWEIQTSPHTTANITGTIQHVMKNAEENGVDFTTQEVANAPSATAHLARRESKLDVDLLICNTDFGPLTKLARELFIKKGIEYLRTKPKGKPENGPGRCGRVSCSQSSAIFWCNEDLTAAEELDSYSMIADAAQIIVDGCYQPRGKDWYEWVSGQVFMKDKWSVIVVHDGC
ncbi:hypothetical protein QBC45DRAFT_413414 [Copromyces sp. CBS 386.78]|nr:hypothetical protein QBC45DRAFT_413414 [Copromyces sp. CBS 386.78]